MTAKKPARGKTSKSSGGASTLRSQVAEMVSAMMPSDAQREVWHTFLTGVDPASLKSIKAFFTKKTAAAPAGELTLEAYLGWYREVRDNRKKLLKKIALSNPRLEKDCTILFSAVPGVSMEPRDAEKMFATEEGMVDYFSGLSVAQLEAFIELLNGEQGKQYSEGERAAMIALFTELQPLAFEHEKELATKVLPLAEGIAEAMVLQDQLEELKALQAELLASLKH